MNAVQLMGRLTKDPELKYGASGNAYCKFTVAVNRAFKKDEVDFINCTCFGKTAEAMGQYSRKGDQIGVCGSLQIDVYEKDGEKKYSTSVNVQSFTFGAKGGDGSNKGNNSNANYNSKPKDEKPNNAGKAPDVDLEDDEFPF